MFIHTSTFKGDPYSYGIFKNFLLKYVELFYVAGDHCIISKEKIMNDLFYNPSRFEFCLSGHNCKTEEDFVFLMEQIAKYTKDFMNKCNPTNYLEHYEKEWKGIDNHYPIAQYNSMKVSSVLKHFAADFTRKQLYGIQQLRAALYHKGTKTKCYIVSMNSVDSFGIYDPNPRFVGVKEDPLLLTTMFKDIEILKPLFDKYKLVRWKKDLVKNYHESESEGYDDERILTLLNTLKYTHMNINKKGRRILDIKSKTIHHTTQLNMDKDVTGYWKHNYEGKYKL